MNDPLLTLRGHQVLRLAEPAQIRTETGLLWITVDGSSEDILLAPGQSRRFDGRRSVLLYALGDDARFEMRPLGVRPLPLWWQRIAARFAPWIQAPRLST